MTEEAKMELLVLLDKKYENGEQIISELFETKREAQDRLEETKRKVLPFCYVFYCCYNLFSQFRGESKVRMELEEQTRWLQIELEKSRRTIEAEVRARNALKVKLENEMKVCCPPLISYICLIDLTNRNGKHGWRLNWKMECEDWRKKMLPSPN